MSISSSMNASVAGLNANANRLATISDNIANSSTDGYKRAETEFLSLVISDNGTKYTAGGVRTTSTRAIDERGPLVSSGNATDIAISGRGMLPISTITSVRAGAEMPFQMTSTGSFSPDAEGYLVTASGQVLLGWPADANGVVGVQSRDTSSALEPVRILRNQIVGAPTTQISLAANLPATQTEAGAAGEVQSQRIEYFDNLGKTQYLDVTYTPSVPGTGASNMWTMDIYDAGAGGALIGSYEMEFADTRTGGGRLDVVTTQLGGAYNDATGMFSVQVASGSIDISIGTPGSATGMTQLSNLFAPSAVERNGALAGSLIGVAVDSSGNLVGSYSNGNTRILYKIPVVDVPNLNGLKSIGAQAYSITQASGAFYLWDAGTGPTGEMLGYTSEGSAVDIASELTSMIQTQRAYSSNAKVIQTVNEMLEETTNLKR